MKSQLSIRREETKSIHECAISQHLTLSVSECLRDCRKCDALEVTLAKLRESAKVTVSTEPQKMEDPVVSLTPFNFQDGRAKVWQVKETSAQTVSLQDLTKWAEEVS